MGNRITNNLPASIDSFLMGLAQTADYVNIDYHDISIFADRATDADINKLKKLKHEYENIVDSDDEESLIICSQEIEKIIK